LPKSRLPDRNYFWSVLNTLNPDYVKQLIDHANKARNAAGEFKTDDETILVSQEMIELLNEQPFLSCKFFKDLIFFRKKRPQSVSTQTGLEEGIT
jgi:hypothetical protein